MINADVSRLRFSIASVRPLLHLTSMFRYYTTPETRQALIVESNRLIAGRRAAMNAARGRRQAVGDGTALAGIALDAQSRAEMAECGSESAFARLVADLQSTSMTGPWPVQDRMMRLVSGLTASD